MLLFDVLVRYSTVTLLLISAFFCLRDGRHLLQARLGALTCLSISSLLLGTAPDILRLTGPAYALVRILDIPNLALLWLFARSLFEDDFKIGRLEWAGIIVYCFIVGVLRLVDINVLEAIPFKFNYAASAISGILALHLIWTALAGRKNDLIEARRKGRPWFSIGLGLAASISIIAEVIYGGLDPRVSTLRASVTLPMAVWAVVWLMSLQTEKLLFQPVQDKAPAAPAIDPKDAALHGRLTDMMETERYYTEQGLTIRKLSEKLKAPEHQLRALINQGLGYKNFAAYLNHYRISYAKKVLSDLEQARLPVLTIAMDAGFNSLAPFNRAFKSMEGVTPTEFRRKALLRA